MMPPTALTTPPKNSTAYTYYKIRTMAADVAALQKGQSPVGSVMALEPPQKIADSAVTPTTPTLKSEAKKETAVPKNKQDFKPAFPEIIFTEPKKPQPPSSQARPPFAGPISPPFQIQNAPKILEKPQPLVQKMELPTQQNFPPIPMPPRPMSPPPPLPPLPSLPSRPSLPPLPPRRAIPPSPITGQAPMNLPSANFPSTPTPPTLPPLPVISGSRTKKKGLVILLASAAVVVIFIIGEIWWFFLKPAAAPPTPVNETNNILPPPQELQPLLPPQETSPVQETLTLPEALLSYDRVEIINIGSITPAEIAAAINDFDTTTVGVDELVRLVIKTESADNSLDQNQPPSNTMVALTDIAAGLKLKIPAAVKNELLDDYDLFIYGSSEFDKEICRKNKNTASSCSGPRLGLVLKTNGGTKINSAAKIWEKTMASDLKNLILAKTTSSGQFQTGTYQGQTIRYKNLPISAIAVEYSLVNDILIIGTSKSSTLKAIDATGASEINE